jgi:MFS family permease
MLMVPPLGGRLVTHWGWRRHFAAGLAVMALGNIALAAAPWAADWTMQFTLVIGGTMGIGIGAALIHPQLSGAAVALAPADQSGVASAVTVVMRQGGFAIGIAVLGAALGSETAATGYLPLFATASAACVCGVIAALSCCQTCHPSR